MKAAELRAMGRLERDIAAETQRALSNDMLARERSRDVFVAPWFQDISQDVRFALRMIVRERHLALTAMFTLGLGIAVSTAAFWFVNAAIFAICPSRRPIAC